MNLELSNDFISVLTRISHNKVATHILNANELLSKEVKLEDVFDHNYIDISKSNKLITFTSNKKIKKVLDSKPMYYEVTTVRNLNYSKSNNAIFEALGFEPSANEYWYPQPGDGSCGSILKETISTVSGNTYVLYKCKNSNRLCVINKLALTTCENNYNFYTTNRNTIKIGRFAAHLLTVLNIKFNEKDIEEFVNLYKFSHDFRGNIDKQFSIVSGEDIAYWYHYSRYVPKGGMLNGSCMCNKKDFIFNVYTKNKNCSMVILYADDGQLTQDSYIADKIKGRAILWDVEYNGKMIKFMDRIYTANDSDVEVFKQYAKNNKWWYKKEQSMYPNVEITNGKSTKFHKFKIKLENTDIQFFPYMDTMCYWLEDGTLTNDHTLIERTRAFRCTNGCYIKIVDGREVEYSLAPENGGNAN